MQRCSRAQIDRNLLCCTDECNVQRTTAHVLQSTKGSQSTDRERGSLCATEVRPAPAGRELEPAAAAAVAQRVEVKGADLSKSD